MKMMKLAIVAACLAAAASAPANAFDRKAKATGANVSSCYYEYSFIYDGSIYDVYGCYSNGDGSY